MVNMELEPPVSWLKSSSGRASAWVILTRSTGRSISSAMTMAMAVLMPWPTSVRWSAKLTVPSSCTVIVIRFAVGRAASRRKSSRS